MVESYCDKEREVFSKTASLERLVGRTIIISFPAALRKALVHRTFRGLRFILLITEQASAVATEPRSNDLLEVLMTSKS